MNAVLAQKQPDGFTQMTAYANRTLQQHEKKYGPTELQTLAIEWSEKHFHLFCIAIGALFILIMRIHPIHGQIGMMGPGITGG